MLNYFDRQPELFNAAYLGETQKLKELLETQDNLQLINHPNNMQGGHTLLFFACYGLAKHDTVELLISKGAEPLIRDNIDRLPAHIAANTGDYKILKIFLDIPSVLEQIWQPISNGQTLLHMLFYPECGAGSDIDGTKQIDECLDLLSKYMTADITSKFYQPDNNGLTPLMIAKYFKVQFNVEKFNLPNFSAITLPENIAEILDTDFYGRTPLMKAAFDQNEETVRQCIVEGYNCNLSNIQSGRNPLHLACHKKNANPEIIGLLINNMIDPMCGDDGAGRTPLHIGAFVGSLVAIQKLIEYSIVRDNINKLDYHGRNCLHALVMSNTEMDSRIQILNLLFQNNIDYKQKDIYGKTPFDIADECNSAELKYNLINLQNQKVYSNKNIVTENGQNSSATNVSFFSSNQNDMSTSSNQEFTSQKKYNF